MLTKSTLLLFLVLARQLTVQAQAPVWQWATQSRNLAGVDQPFCYPSACVAAPNGDVVITGYYYGRLVLGNLPILAGNGRTLFVARLAGTTGQWLWAVNVTAANGLNGTGINGKDIAVTPAGDVLLVGALQGTAHFGSTTLTANFTEFIAKLDGVTGNWQWATEARGATAVAATAGGEAVVAGTLLGTYTIAALPALVAVGKEDIYIGELSGSTGQWRWAVQAGGSDQDVVVDLAVTPTGEAVVTGTSSSPSVQFGAAITLPASGRTHTYIAKLILGTRQWQWAAGANAAAGADVIGGSFGLTPNEDVIVTGTFGRTVQFGALPVLAAAASSSYENTFVARLSGSTGQWQWATAAGGSTATAGEGLAVTSTGEAIMTGFFKDDATFGGLPALSNPGYNVYAAKISGTGTWQWATHGLGGGGASLSLLALTPDDRPVLAGQFNNTVAFGPLPALSAPPVNPRGASGEMFVAGLGRSTSLASRESALIASIRLYPNPAATSFTLRLPAGAPAPPVVILLNCLGQSVRRQLPTDRSQDFNVDVRGLAPGLYYLQLQLGAEIVHYRIIIN